MVGSLKRMLCGQQNAYIDRVFTDKSMLQMKTGYKITQKSKKEANVSARSHMVQFWVILFLSFFLIFFIIIIS